MKKYFAFLLLVSALVSESLACTGITLKVDGKKVVFGRTLEFAKGVLKYDLSMIPRGIKLHGSTPDNKAGLRWKVKYGHVAITAKADTMVFSGINEKGLAYNVFYLPGYTKYNKYNPKYADKTIGPCDLGSWILSNFSSVKEVRDNIDKIVVADVIYPVLGYVPPMHSAICDKDGNSIVIEYIKGKVRIFKNPLGVITNSPNYDWHMTNTKNYITLRAKNAKPIKIDGMTMKGLGAGTGASGLPGDFTPPSRFIRALFMSSNSAPSKNADDAVSKAFHILNHFDIPEGVVMEEFNNKLVPEVTQWTSVINLKNLRFYFHVRENRQVRMVDLKKLDFTSPKIKIYEIPKVKEFKNISNQFK